MVPLFDPVNGLTHINLDGSCMPTQLKLGFIRYNHVGGFQNRSGVPAKQFWKRMNVPNIPNFDYTSLIKTL